VEIVDNWLNFSPVSLLKMGVDCLYLSLVSLLKIGVDCLYLSLVSLLKMGVDCLYLPLINKTLSKARESNQKRSKAS
jgi:hypothetical protein